MWFLFFRDLSRPSFLFLHNRRIKNLFLILAQIANNKLQIVVIIPISDFDLPPASFAHHFCPSVSSLSLFVLIAQLREELCAVDILGPSLF